jgi:protein farnesyltransferase subunit beta
MIQFLEKCQSDQGGFGGGPGQLAHLAPTYAAVHTLAILSIHHPSSIQMINRPKLLSFFLSLKSRKGSFVMHKDGEIDVRYTNRRV